jgi:hypothetical protein
MFRRRALQELTEIVEPTPSQAPELDTSDPKVMTVQRIQDLLQEVGVDPGEDPVEAARTFLASVDTKLPNSFGSFRLNRPKPAPEQNDEPEAMWGRGKAELPEVDVATAPARQPEFDENAFAAASFAPGTFDSASTEPDLSAPVESSVGDDASAAAPWEAPPRASAQPSLPDWIQMPGARRPVQEAVPAEIPVEVEAEAEVEAQFEAQFEAEAEAEVPVAEQEPAPVDEVAEPVEWPPPAPFAEDPEPVQWPPPAPVVEASSEPVSEWAPEPEPAPEPIAEPGPSPEELAAANTRIEELATANARIEELQNAVMERAAQRDAIRDELEVAEGRLRQLETTLAERDGDTNGLTARVAELEQAAERAQAQISASQRALAEAQHATERAVLESADITSFEFKGELAPTFEELATAITALEATLAEREQQQADARSLVAQHELNIAELTAQRNDAYASIAGAREREQELNAALAQLREEQSAASDDALNAEARRAELARLQAELDRAEASLRSTQVNEAAATEELERRRKELGEAQQQLSAVRDALRVATTECEATQRQLSVARTQTAEAEAARNGARAEAERVIELAMRQAKALRADAERQAEAARILHDAANEAITLQTDAQRQADVVRQRAAKAAEAIKVEREAEAQAEGEHVAPAILSALITRVASIESHLAHYRGRPAAEDQSDQRPSDVEAAAAAD